MSFLSRYFSTWLAWLRTPRAESVPPIREETPEATLSRYILDRSRLSGGRVNHRAFMPPPDLQLSTFSIDGLQEAEVWSLRNRGGC
jgi:hypothetical protein